MKKILIITFFLLFLTSCFGVDIKNGGNSNSNNESKNNSGALEYLSETTPEKYQELVTIYEGKDSTVISGGNDSEFLDNEKYFLDGLKTCDEISAFDLLVKGKNDFIIYLNLGNLYDTVIKNNITYNEYFNDSGLIMNNNGGVNFDDKDLLLVMYFSGKINKDEFIVEMKKLTEKYYTSKRTNSILLEIILHSIETEEKITYEICKKAFLSGYNLIP